MGFYKEGTRQWTVVGGGFKTRWVPNPNYGSWASTFAESAAAQSDYPTDEQIKAETESHWDRIDGEIRQRQQRNFFRYYVSQGYSEEAATRLADELTAPTYNPNRTLTYYQQCWNMVYANVRRSGVSREDAEQATDKQMKELAKMLPGLVPTPGQ